MGEKVGDQGGFQFGGQSNVRNGRNSEAKDGWTTVDYQKKQTTFNNVSKTKPDISGGNSQGYVNANTTSFFFYFFP